MMGGLALKDQCANLPRRRSLRLKGISAIYDAEDVEIVNSYSKHQEKGSGRRTYCAGNSSIKVEVLDPEETIPSWISENGVALAAVSSRNVKNFSSQESINDIDEQNPLEIPLKDLRARCKAKKRKVQKSVSSLEIDISSILHCNQSLKQNATITKLKEEESDLEEPLITLKQKRSKAFPNNINRRKGTRLSSQCLDLIGVVFANKCPSSSAHIPISTATEDPCAGRLPEDNNVDLEDSVSATGHDAENLRMSEKSMPIESNKSYLHSERDDLYAGSLGVACHVKSEALDTCSVEADMNANSASEIDLFDSSSGEIIQKVGNGNSDGRKLTFTCKTLNICRDLSELNLNSPALFDSTKTESFDDDIVTHERTINTSSASMDFVAKAICPQKSSSVQVEIANENVLASIDVTSLPDKYSSCCLNESCDDYLGNSEYVCPPESVQEYLGETIGMEQSKISTDEHNEVPLDGYSSELVCITAFPGSDICRSTEGQNTSLEEALCKTRVEHLDISFPFHRGNIVEIKDKGEGDNDIDTEGVPAQEIPVCIDTNNGVVNSIFLCNEVHDFVDNSHFGAQDGHLERMVYDAITSYMQVKTNEVPMTHTSDVPAIVTLSLSTDQLSNACLHAAKVSPTSNGSSPNAQAALSSSEGESSDVQTTYNPSEIYRLIDKKRSTVALDLPSHILFQPCGNLKDIDEESRGGEKPLSSEQSTSTKLSIEEAPTNMEKELRNDKMLTEEHVPTKLLSKRKTMSPTSQEKLCHTFDLCDRNDSQISGSEAAQSLLCTERILKKSKSSSNASVPPVAKGILKATETSHRMACYCMKSSSIHIDTEKVIDFSQRQMRDVENIASKLLKSLNSMKNIVEETLSSEPHSLLSQFTTEEMRAVSEDASELDRITRRWLTIMSKDCNRFCKILRLAEDRTATPLNGVRKDRRKITFADEAGGMLCHVKLFSQQSGSNAVPEHEKVG